MKKIQDFVIDTTLETGLRLLVAPTATKDVVTIQGSVLGATNHLSREKAFVAELVADLFDAGTALHSKDELRTRLSSRGASLRFSAGGDRMYFYASCLPEDVGMVLDTVVECLTSARFDAKELATLKDRYTSELHEEKTRTSTQASIAFTQSVYDPTHIHYRESTDVLAEHLTHITRKDLVSFAHFNAKGAVIAIAGDVTPRTIRANVEKSFKKLPATGYSVTEKKLNTKEPHGNVHTIQIPLKTNIDTRIGTRVSITKRDPLYIPLLVLIEMLGGHGLTSGHLMRTVRERDGLTYSIYGGVYGVGMDVDGAFTISVSFSPDTFTQALETTRKEIQVFLSRGITETALASKKRELVGSYHVGLSTTGGLVNRLHAIGMEGRDLSYIDENPSRIQAVTLAEVKAAAKLIPWDQLTMTAAGAFTK